ncbi:MAG: LysM peptidoglycan-binding domain-containing protein [Elusimicrobiota bacterium]
MREIYKTLSMLKKGNLKNLGILFIIASLFLLPSSVYSDFDDLGAGARSVGMAGACVSFGEDPFGFYYNPASLGFLRRGQLGTDYGKLWIGLDDGSDLSLSFISVAVPFFKLERTEAFSESGGTKSATGAAELNMSTAAPEATRFQTKKVHMFTVSAAARTFTLLDYYQESAYYLSFGKSVKERFSYGFNLKILRENYAIDQYLERSPVFDYGNKNTVQAFSIDAGAIYNLLPRLFIGLSATDINQPDLGLKEKDQLPMTGRLGISWRQKDMKWAADCIYRSNLWYGSFGMEKWIVDLFAARAGITMGGLNYVQPSLGFSFDINSFQIDYAFQYPLNGIKEVSGTHRMSFIFRFGSKSKEEVEPGSLEYYYSELQEKNKNLESNLAATEAEKRKLEEVLLEEATMRIRDRIKAAKTEAREGKTPVTGPAVKEAKEIRHVVKRGDTLQSIAEKYYGDAKYWDEIYQINRKNIGRGGALKPDQVLVIPVTSKSAERIVTGEQQAEKGGAPGAGGKPIEVKPVQVITPQIPSTQTTEPAVLPGMQGTQSAQPRNIPDVVPIRVITPDNSEETAAPSKEAATETPKEPAKKEPEKEIKKPAAEKPKPAGPRKHIVQAGENLRSIAQKYYNDSSKWKDIYKANTNKIVGGQVMPGQEIVIP